jgi:hypothetical protein
MIKRMSLYPTNIKARKLAATDALPQVVVDGRSRDMPLLQQNEGIDSDFRVRVNSDRGSSSMLKNQQESKQLSTRNCVRAHRKTAESTTGETRQLRRRTPRGMTHVSESGNTEATSPKVREGPPTASRSISEEPVRKPAEVANNRKRKRHRNDRNERSNEGLRQ